MACSVADHTLHGLTLFNAVYILTAQFNMIQMKTERFQPTQKQLFLLFNNPT
jgi:hypothetical protein